jgi:hypothetical protein
MALPPLFPSPHIPLLWKSLQRGHQQQVALFLLYPKTDQQLVQLVASVNMSAAQPSRISVIPDPSIPSAIQARVSSTLGRAC